MGSKKGRTGFPKEAKPGHVASTGKDKPGGAAPGENPASKEKDAKIREAMGAPPKEGGQVVDPAKLIKVEPQEMKLLQMANQATAENLSKLMVIERKYWKERRLIHEKLDIIEEQSEEHIKKLKEKYRFFGEMKVLNYTTNEITLE